jgi:hypothetical protein
VSICRYKRQGEFSEFRFHLAPSRTLEATSFSTTLISAILELPRHFDISIYSKLCLFVQSDLSAPQATLASLFFPPYSPQAIQ